MKSELYSTLLIQDDRAQCLRSLHSGWFSLLQNLQACFPPQSPQVNNKTNLKLVWERSAMSLRDAIAQFRKHMDQFRASAGPAQLSWEHAAWQVGVYCPIQSNISHSNNISGWSSSSLWSPFLRSSPCWSECCADPTSWALLSARSRVCHQQVGHDDQPERHPYNQFMRHIQEEAG